MTTLERAATSKREGMLAGEEYVCPTCDGDCKYRGTHPYWTKCVRCAGIGTIILRHHGQEEVE